MAETRTPQDEVDQRLTTVDWEGIERSPEFQELVRRRRSFVVPATIFFLVFYMGFILLAGYAEDFMGSSVYQGLTVGYCLALTQFLMVLVLGLLYLRKSDKEYDPLAQKVVDMAGRSELARADDHAGSPTGARAATTEGGAPR